MDVAEANFVDLDDLSATISRVRGLLVGVVDRARDLTVAQRQNFRWQARRDCLLGFHRVWPEIQAALDDANLEFLRLGRKLAELDGLPEAELVRRRDLGVLIATIRELQNTFIGADTELLELAAPEVINRHASLVRLLAHLRARPGSDRNAGDRSYSANIARKAEAAADWLDPSTRVNLDECVALIAPELQALKHVLITWSSAKIEKRKTGLLLQTEATVNHEEQDTTPAPAAAGG